MGRLRASPPNKDLVVESAKMLRKNLQSVQIFDEAQAIQDLLDQKFPAQSDPVDDDLSRLYMWSEQLGFKIHSPQFGFDVCDPEKGKAPIHQAIQDGNLEMVQGMVQTVAHANTPDSTGQRPLHLAASARNERICNSLLEKGAEVDVQDRQQQTPLHKCQCGSGGIAVAKLILDRSPPRFIDRQDCWGKTALYMACEKGNNESERSGFISVNQRTSAPANGIYHSGFISTISRCQPRYWWPESVHPAHPGNRYSPVGCEDSSC